MAQTDLPLTVFSGDGLSAWVRSTERLPADGQSVAFVVRASNMLGYMNGRVLGGTFRAGQFGGFSVPGMTVDASHWLALPPSPVPPHFFDTENPCAQVVVRKMRPTAEDNYIPVQAIPDGL